MDKMTPHEMHARRVEIRARWATATDDERDEYTALTKTLAAADFATSNGELITGAAARRQTMFAGKRQN